MIFVIVFSVIATCVDGCDDSSTKSVVQNSPWDASVYQVENYLKRGYLKDPRSYESIDWGNVIKNGNGYIVRHKYRAKNSFGGYVINNQIFYLNSNGEVYKVQDCPDF